ncbi:DUF992 domain-containing protein [Phyllobacterium sp. SYP-B3895]|uniref:DUF992 domain-containing protein n=1 Tax=Phyllobacterium sp. SYP-B3895 TaxID=2663240 RepID=UPI001299B036|nr:DUF992 domain-containing protein [Phyllobacterium sp. SYP-B3895]MRG57783.1 DUF992 domain-containing protein [Phyllobacterium sp. SYP-B3895]
MSFNLKNHLTNVLVAGTLCLLAGIPAAHADVAKIGILSCDVSKGIGEILSRKQALNCQFKPDGGQAQTYSGSIDEYGVEIGKVDQGHLIWGVASALRGLPQGALAGEYVGLGAGASLGVGGGANALVGGNNKAFSLQPLSVEGETGFNIAAGVLKVTLKPAK